MKRHFKLLVLGLSLASVTFFPARVFAADLTAAAMETKKQTFRMSQLGDVNLSCGQLSREALRMRDIIQRKQNIKDNSDLKDRSRHQRRRSRRLPPSGQRHGRGRTGRGRFSGFTGRGKGSGPGRQHTEYRRPATRLHDRNIQRQRMLRPDRARDDCACRK